MDVGRLAGFGYAGLSYNLKVVAYVFQVTGPKSRSNEKRARLPMSVSVIEQARIQAQVLVPLVRALQAELGEARANALVRKALGDLYRGFGEEFWKAKNESDLGKAVSSAFRTYARDDALAYDVIEQSHDAFAFDVKRCAYAEFYKALGEPELGFLLICTADFATAEGFGPDVRLTRTQTIMQGADHCDFRYRRDDGGAR
ncbi:L-2-amino-thiazoline-4-carboxylic acid hydrolase [Bradyrhizobium sp. cf659]|nr:L-2-amino-thiazoline-4-carboxylic acid hydrolase [Bradyrhizobium sp. cf659]